MMDYQLQIQRIQETVTQYSEATDTEKQNQLEEKVDRLFQQLCIDMSNDPPKTQEEELNRSYNLGDLNSRIERAKENVKKARIDDIEQSQIKNISKKIKDNLIKKQNHF